MDETARGRAWRLILLFLAADWSIPGTTLNKLFYAHRWFPTNITSLFAAALSSPDSPAAVLLVSASAPLFWTLLAATVWSAVDAVRRNVWLRLLAAAMAALFVLTQFLLPWLGSAEIPSKLATAPFPIIPRGNGRAYELLYFYALPFLLPLVLLGRRRELMDTPRRFV